MPRAIATAHSAARPPFASADNVKRCLRGQGVLPTHGDALPADKEQFWSKESARAVSGTGRSCLQFALDLVMTLYWTTVTPRRFCDQQEMSLQMATGRSLPKLCEVMRCAFTPVGTR